MHSEFECVGYCEVVHKELLAFDYQKVKKWKGEVIFPDNVLNMSVLTQCSWTRTRYLSLDCASGAICIG